MSATALELALQASGLEIYAAPSCKYPDPIRATTLSTGPKAYPL